VTAQPLWSEVANQALWFETTEQQTTPQQATEQQATELQTTTQQTTRTRTEKPGKPLSSAQNSTSNKPHKQAYTTESDNQSACP
jgi:hypothetical protein